MSWLASTRPKLIDAGADDDRAGGRCNSVNEGRYAQQRLQRVDQKAGVDIVRRAIQVPAPQIVQNAGEDGSLVVGKLLENGNYNWGSNAATGEYQDLVKAGAIDPAKVVRTALQDAASVLPRC
jgi:chaperonin GroEL (HSP60 family)